MLIHIARLLADFFEIFCMSFTQHKKFSVKPRIFLAQHKITRITPHIFQTQHNPHIFIRYIASSPFPLMLDFSLLTCQNRGRKANIASAL